MCLLQKQFIRFQFFSVFGKKLKINIRYFSKNQQKNMRIQEIYIEKLKSSIEFVVGQNAKDNFDIIDSSLPDDMWFHVEGKPSGHVIAKIQEISTVGKKELAAIVKQGAVLCKSISKYATEKNLTIVYTRVKDVTKTNVPGSVLLAKQKTIVV